MSHSRTVLTYDLNEFPFPSLIATLLGADDLEKLHELARRHDPNSHDQDSDDHALFYRQYETVRPLYERLVREVIAPSYDEDLVVQRVPTFRVHRPGAVAVSTFHKDSDFNHQPATVNHWLPLTRAFSTNSMWIESAPGAGDFAPVEVVPGEVLRFDAVNYQHGNYANDTDVSRVSFDFRIIPMSEYQDTGLSTVNAGTRMDLTSYYMVLGPDGEFRSGRAAA